MTWLFLFLTAPTAAFWLYALLCTLWMTRRIARLAGEPVHDGDDGAPPRVTVVSPACNEEASIEASVRSWLAQDDVALRIIAVNDRSTDRTGALLDELADENDQLDVVHVDTLPEGWLGKVHALHRGTARAQGDWLLFADADVRLAPGTLSRAVAFAERRGIDLLTAMPEIASADFWSDVAWGFVGAGVGPARMWRTRDPLSRHAFGVGAFILIRRRAFEQTPGFSWLKLEVADDQGLAMLLKHHGQRCDIVNGRGLVRLTWYASLRDMVVKSQKNWFAIAARFSLSRSALVATFCVISALSPLAMLLPGIGAPLLAVPIAGQIAFVGASAVQARWSGRPVAPSLLAPVGMLLVAFMVLRAGIIGARVGGITWRGVLYRSEDLRDVQRFEM